MNRQLVSAFKAFFITAAVNAVTASIAITVIHYAIDLSVVTSFFVFFFMCGLFTQISEPFLAGWKVLK